TTQANINKTNRVKTCSPETNNPCKSETSTGYSGSYNSCKKYAWSSEIRHPETRTNGTKTGAKIYRK
ncbi:MAG: hypothetical protein ACO29Z_03505, partial [Crocinitomicaceae bacterium]